MLWVAPFRPHLEVRTLTPVARKEVYFLFHLRHYNK